MRKSVKKSKMQMRCENGIKIRIASHYCDKKKIRIFAFFSHRIRIALPSLVSTIIIVKGALHDEDSSRCIFRSNPNLINLECPPSSTRTFFFFFFSKYFCFRSLFSPFFAATRFTPVVRHSPPPKKCQFGLHKARVFFGSTFPHLLVGYKQASSTRVGVKQVLEKKIKRCLRKTHDGSGYKRQRSVCFEDGSFLRAEES